MSLFVMQRCKRPLPQFGLALSFTFIVLFHFGVQAQKKGTLQFKKVKIQSLSDTIVPYLVNKVETYNFMVDRNSFSMKMNYDLEPIQQQIPPIEDKLGAFKKKFEKTSKTLNLNSLNTMVILLGEVSGRLKTYQDMMADYAQRLTKSNKEIQRILNDPALTIKVPDSALNLQISDLMAEAKSLNGLQQRTLATVNLWRSRISLCLLQAKDLSSDMNFLAINKKINIWTAEEKPLFKTSPEAFTKSYPEAVANAITRTSMTLKIFFSSKVNMIALSLVLFIILTAWTLLNLRRVKKRIDKGSILDSIPYLKRNAVVAQVFAYSVYTPLFFGDPTMQSIHFFELLRLITLTYLIFPFLPKPGRALWGIFSLLWLFYSLEDLLIDSTFAERWLLLAAGLLLILLCLAVLLRPKLLVSDLNSSPLLKSLGILSIALGVLSLFFNLTGRVNITKIFGSAGFQSLYLGISLIILCTIFLQCIYLQSEAYQASRFSAFINFEKQHKRYTRNFLFAAIIVWLVGISRCLMINDLLFGSLGHLLNHHRTIGQYRFTIGSVIVFFFIIFISSVISRAIKFFFDNEKVLSSGERSSVNSMVLLFRLIIWVFGFLIAVAIAGIPLDKLSVMLGALGVGIGFGLQNIANNLVSGIILAFERPIQIGDQIEINGRSGTVKEIGVRSSKLSNSEGADIIIPNGNLLSEQLINWTLQDRRKRAEFTIGVAYQSDLEEVFSIIEKVLTENTKVQQQPKPAISIEQFGDYSIIIKIQFWIGDLNQAGSVRSSVMAGTKRSLSAAGIPLQNRPLS
jgi:small-conductance mechanosensitive channel